MNRRDVIIIAVLINAGLLVVVCASALKSGNNQPEVVLQKEAMVNTPVAVQNNSPPPKGDEVDQVLSQFATVNPTMQAAPSAPVATPVLQSFSTAASQSSPGDAQNSFPGFSSEVQPLVPAQSLSAPAPVFPSSLQEEKSETGLKELKVKKGDALEKIARTHHTTVQDLMRINHLSSTQLKIGQVLKIPTKNTKATASSPSASSPSTGSSEAKYYTVKNGDNPWTIAVKNHMKVDELLKLNGLDEEKARKLKPGDQLRIR
jgi:peptidoglycan DL-endopeptidase LytF